MSEFAPDTKVQRQMLEERINQYKQQGFSSFMEAEALRVQQDPNKKALAEAVTVEETKSANAYRAAKRLKAMLDELPEEPKEDANDGA